MSVLLIFKLFIYFLLRLSSFFKFSFLLFFLSPPFFLSFFLCLPSSTLYHLSMRVLVMSIDSNFVFEFIVSHGDNVST